MELHELPWESGLFGKPAFRLALSGSDLTAGHAFPTWQALHEGISERPGFVSCRIPANRADQASSLENAGFHLVECYLELNRKNLPANIEERVSLLNRDNVRDCDPTKDVNAILQIAETGFKHSRFHADPFIPKSIAHQSRKEWVLNGINGRADKVFVVHHEKEVAGFLLAKLQKGANPSAVLDLMAISEHQRGKGLGKALVLAFNAWAANTGVDSCSVGTQATNTEALNLYLSCGFRLHSAFFSFHYHAKP